MGVACAEQSMVEQRMQDIFPAAEGGRISEYGREQFVTYVHVDLLRE